MVFSCIGLSLLIVLLVIKFALPLRAEAFKPKKRKKYPLVTLIGRGVGICQVLGRRYRVGWQLG
jgi:hypothetical protein